VDRRRVSQRQRMSGGVRLTAGTSRKTVSAGLVEVPDPDRCYRLVCDPHQPHRTAIGGFQKWEFVGYPTTSAFDENQKLS
jgi:hypothetical protein